MRALWPGAVQAVTGRLLTAREVAVALGVSTETVLRWTRRGDLPAFRLPGGAIRFRDGDLDEWLASRATSVDTRGDNTSGPAALVTPRARSQGGTP